MNPVIRTLREHIADQNVCFVFPSQTSAGLWARKTCTLGIARSVAAKRFLAWDRFKEEVIHERETNKEPVSLVIRKLFAEALLRENAEAVRRAGEYSGRKSGGLPLKSIVPPEHAGGTGIFVPFIARLLPSLSQWEKLTANSPVIDAEDRDYKLVKKEYAAFLQRHNLYEPSWEEIKVQKESNRYVIFFPELIEDFAEYGYLLETPRFIRIGAESVPVREGPCLVHYQSAREEIRSAAMEIQRLHEKEAVPYEDMAISVPELEEMEPCLVREFSIRHIPVTLRAGKTLAEKGAGRIFSLISECAASRFSFNKIKALILNDSIPWKDREKNRALIDFGIKYNCVTSYIQDGKNVDIWEEAFKEAYNDGGKELWPYYRELKTRILALSGAKSFKDIRKYYFAFRGSLLDMEQIAEEDDAILSRCIEELGGLIEIEEKLNESSLAPASPFGFFLSCLGETEYVKANQKPGVNIFKWRVAAASPFNCHFVLNASQSAAPVLYQPMKFLRQDKRKLLGLEDKDASGAFFLLSNTGEDSGFSCHSRISASAQTFSGWAIPHSYFAGGKTIDAPPCPEDAYGAERRFWREAQGLKGAAGGGTAGADLKKIFPLQKQSFTRWKNVLARKENNFSFFSSAVVSASPVKELLQNAILGEDRFLTVTPTNDLNVYYACALKWLFRRIFRIEEFSLEATLLDDTSLGILYHKILEDIFARIKNEDRVFDSRRLDTYKHWALEATKAAIEKHPAFKGPLAVPLVSPQAAGMAKKISGILSKEADYFDGYRVAELELPVSLKTGELLIKGIIDRVSVSPEGDPVIVDYKTKYLPEQTETEKLEEKPLAEFQMPLYIKLYEEASPMKNAEGSREVQGAYFYSINDRKIKAVMGESAGGRNKVPDREEYTTFLEAAEKQINEFGQKVKALDFIPREIRIGDCFACDYKTACRSAYFLNAGS